MLVERGRQHEGVERLRHFKGSRRVHVGRDDRDAVIGNRRMQEFEVARDIYFRAGNKGGALRTDQYVLEVEPQGVVNMH